MTNLFDQLTMNGKYQIGLDVSHYQMADRVSSIDWKKAKAAGVSFGIARIGVGDWQEDLSFVPNMLGMREAGILNRGAYIANDPSVSVSAHISLVNRVLDKLRAAEGANFRMPRLFLDAERYIKYKYVSGKGWVVDREFTKAEINNSAKGILDGLEAIDGRKPGFYSYPAYIFDRMADSISNADPKWLQDVPLWIASHAFTFDASIAIEHPSSAYIDKIACLDRSQPLGGTDILQIIGDAFSSGLGPVFGAESGNVDISRTRMTEEELAAFFQLEDGEPTEPGEEPGEEPGVTMETSEFYKIVAEHMERQTTALEASSEHLKTIAEAMVSGTPAPVDPPAEEPTQEAPDWMNWWEKPESEWPLVVGGLKVAYVTPTVDKLAMWDGEDSLWEDAHLFPNSNLSNTDSVRILAYRGDPIMVYAEGADYHDAIDPDVRPEQLGGFVGYRVMHQNKLNVKVWEAVNENDKIWVPISQVRILKK